MSLFFVLGASDPEMQAIEGLLVEAGVPFGYATVDGRRVHPGNAYMADDIRPMPTSDRNVVVVECDGPIFAPSRVMHGEEYEEWRVVARCDHHRPGDPGYGRSPAEFLPASSLGQVIAALAAAHRLPAWEPSGLIEGPEGGMAFLRGRWHVADGDVGAIVPPDLVLAAAADHCLSHAYRGECPGVDPNALMLWRVKSRAAFQGRMVAAVLADVEAARAELRRRWADSYPAEGSCYPDDPASDAAARAEIAHRQWVDFGDSTLPELPEAAAREGIAFTATVTERDGRKKRVLQAATPSQVRDWLAGEGARLGGTYGDPERGFAGGYLVAAGDE